MPAEMPTPDELTVRDPKGEINVHGYYFESPETAKEAITKYVHTEGVDTGRTRYDTVESKYLTEALAVAEKLIRAAIDQARKTGKPVTVSETTEYAQLTQEQSENCLGVREWVMKPDDQFDEDRISFLLKDSIFALENKKLVDRTKDNDDPSANKHATKVRLFDEYNAIQNQQAEKHTQNEA